MPLTLEGLVRGITDCGLMEADEIHAIIAGIPAPTRPRSAEELAKELVRLGKLTKFQAQLVYQGKAKGLVIGNYIIQDKLGEGGMGQVYRARHKRMDRTVALKILPSSAAKSNEAVQRFQREVKATAKLSHANIVTAYDADEERGVYFLAMEHVDGQDLGRMVKQQGVLAIDLAINYTMQAAQGLHYAHEQGVIHRDIKPSNLLVDRRGTVKVLDMGLARLADVMGEVDDGLTRSGQVMGTFDYMAPEQALDTKRADARSDIYSLGCTLYYLLAGRPVFPEDTLTKKIFAHSQQAIPSLRAARPEAPAALEALCQRMLAKKPEERPQTMAEVLAALQACSVAVAKVSVAASTDAGSGRLLFAGQQVNEPTAPVGETAKLRHTDLETSSEPAHMGSLNPSLQRDPVLLPWLQVFSHPRYKKFWAELDVARKIRLAISGGVLFLALCTGFVLSLPTNDGTLIVELSEPGAVAQVFDEAGKLTIERTAGQERVAIAVGPGKHRLRVEKDGFQVFARDFAVGVGGKEMVKAQLEPIPGPEESITNSGIATSAAVTPPTASTTVSPGRQVTSSISAASQSSAIRSDLSRAVAPLEDPQTSTQQELRSKELGVPVELTNSIGMKLRLIPAGEFVMGSPDTDLDRRRGRYQHRVRITEPFYCGIYEVTQAEYENVMGANPSWFSLTGGGAALVAGANTSQFPVENVSWYEATEFCRKLSQFPEEQRTGRMYRLTTEAEWEYACRAGTQTRYCFGDDPLSLRDYAWYDDNSASQTHAVGRIRPNSWGLYDTHGNVWEWCQDWFDGDYYAKSPTDDPAGPATALDRVNRGGGWSGKAADCRSADRCGNTPSSRYESLGFRVALVVSGR